MEWLAWRVYDTLMWESVRGNPIAISKQWQIVPCGGQAGEIGIRADLRWWHWLYVRWIRKTPVIDVYRDVQAWLASNDGMVFRDAMYHGNLKMSAEVKKKLPPVFQLREGWSIRADSVPGLIRGPLLNSNGDTILVPANGLLGRLVIWAEGHPVSKCIAFLGSVLGLGALIYSWL